MNLGGRGFNKVCNRGGSGGSWQVGDPQRMFSLALAALALIVVGFATLAWRSRPRPLEVLRRRYRQISGMSPRDADETLERQVNRLMDRFPGRSMEWYVDYVIKELRRD